MSRWVLTWGLFLDALFVRQERDAAVASVEAAEQERDTSKTRLKDLFVKYKAVQAVKRYGMQYSSSGVRSVRVFLLLLLSW